MMKFLCLAVLCYSATCGAQATADPTIIHETGLPSFGQGRNHDEAYNNAYAAGYAALGFGCLIGRLTNILVDSETDKDVGSLYTITLIMEADCSVSN